MTLADFVNVWPQAGCTCGATRRSPEHAASCRLSDNDPEVGRGRATGSQPPVTPAESSGGTTMSGVTCRFFVTSIERAAHDKKAAKIKLMPAYANGANHEWATATPSGNMELYVQNPAAVEWFTEQFEAGTDLHITIQPVASADQ